MVARDRFKYRFPEGQETSNLVRSAKNRCEYPFKLLKSAFLFKNIIAFFAHSIENEKRGNDVAWPARL